MSEIKVGQEVRDPAGVICTVVKIEEGHVTVAMGGGLYATWLMDGVTPAHILKVKRLSVFAEIPKYQTAGAAAFDLHFTGPSGYLAPGTRTSFQTGLAFEIPAGHVLYVTGRSGLAFKHGVIAAHAIGVIDSDYRGEVCVLLENRGTERFHIETGDRIAQAMLIRCPQVTLVEVDELSETERGTGGYGSTGK